MCQSKKFRQSRVFAETCKKTKTAKNISTGTIAKQNILKQNSGYIFKTEYFKNCRPPFLQIPKIAKPKCDLILYNLLFNKFPAALSANRKIAKLKWDLVRHDAISYFKNKKTFYDSSAEVIQNI